MQRRIVTAVVATFSMLAVPALAQNAAPLYMDKCSMCHGDQGEGKPSGAPRIAGSAKVEAVLTKGGEAKPPHIKPMRSLAADQVAALAAYVKDLK